MNDPQSKLFDLMSKSHGLTLTGDELAEIQSVVREIDKLVLRLSKKLEEEFDKGVVEIMPEEVEKKQQTLF